MSEPTLNIGRDKTPTPVSQVSERDLEWYATKCRAQGPREIAQAEQERRRKDGGAPPGSAPRNERPAQRSNAAIMRHHVESIQIADGTDPTAVTDHLMKMAEKYNAVCPATLVQTIPEGWEVQTNLVLVDPNSSEVYSVDGGKLGLGKDALVRISVGAGVSWYEIKRIDDRSDPHYCEMFVRGEYLTFDGTPRAISDVADLDLRDGAPRLEGMSAKKVSQDRKFIVRTCTSMAMNRAVSRLGVKRSYTRDELARPFAVSRLMFTGRSKDPELARMFAVMKAAQATGSIQALFGGASLAQQLMAPGQSDPRQLGGASAPPPHDADGVVPDDYDGPSADDDMPPAATGTDGEKF